MFPVSLNGGRIATHWDEPGSFFSFGYYGESVGSPVLLAWKVSIDDGMPVTWPI